MHVKEMPRAGWAELVEGEEGGGRGRIRKESFPSNLYMYMYMWTVRRPLRDPNVMFENVGNTNLFGLSSNGSLIKF